MDSLYSDLDHRFRKVPVMTKVMKIILITLLVIVLAGVGLVWYVLGSMRSGAVETVEQPTEDVSVTEAPEVITVISDDPTPSPTGERSRRASGGGPAHAFTRIGSSVVHRIGYGGH